MDEGNGSGGTARAFSRFLIEDFEKLLFEIEISPLMRVVGLDIRTGCNISKSSPDYLMSPLRLFGLSFLFFRSYFLFVRNGGFVSEGC